MKIPQKCPWCKNWWWLEPENGEVRNCRCGAVITIPRWKIVVERIAHNALQICLVLIAFRVVRGLLGTRGGPTQLH